METLANPEEAIKLNRLRADLGESRGLTEVASDFHLFEISTNQHFNTHMNKLQTFDGLKGDTENLTSNFA